MTQTTKLLKSPSQKKATPQEPQHFKRRIGTTTFRVAVHFNPNAKESAEVKISRLIRMDADTVKVVEV